MWIRAWSCGQASQKQRVIIKIGWIKVCSDPKSLNTFCPHRYENHTEAQINVQYRSNLKKHVWKNCNMKTVTTVMVHATGRCVVRLPMPNDLCWFSAPTSFIRTCNVENPPHWAVSGLDPVSLKDSLAMTHCIDLMPGKKIKGFSSQRKNTKERVRVVFQKMRSLILKETVILYY